MGRSADEGKRGVWRKRLARFTRTGVTVRAFCEAERVSVQSFFRWRRMLAAEGVGEKHRRAGKTLAAGRRGPFLPVRIEDAASLEIVLPNGARVRVPAGDPSLIETVIAAAGVAPPWGEAETARC